MIQNISRCKTGIHQGEASLQDCHEASWWRDSTIGKGGDTTISSPGWSPKQPLTEIGLQDYLHGWQACPEFNSFHQGVGQISPREGLFSCRPPQNGDKFATSPTPPIVERLGGCGELSGKYVDFEKALYGLKQSGLLWNDLLVDKLGSVHGMEQYMTDPCVFRLIREGKLVLILAVHVDDMAVAGTKVEVNKLLEILNKDFETNDLRELFFCTGCTITKDTEKGLTSINQKTFIETLARRFDVTTTSPYPASPCANLGTRVEG